MAEKLPFIPLFQDQDEQPWALRAACSGYNDDTFVAPTGSQESLDARIRIRAAKDICRICPVVPQCLAYALETHDTVMIMGNTTPKERAKMNPRRRTS